jgi:glycosyltransferase involved in cell wall biosynthesis
MTRVVLCVQNLPIPADKRVWREACALRDAGYDVHVVAPRGVDQRPREVLDGIAVRRWEPARERPGVVGQVCEALAGLTRTARALQAIEREGRIDVLHVANPPDGYALLARAMRRNWRVVYDQHDVCPELLEAQRGSTSWTARMLGPVLRLVERGCYRNADLVILPNSSYRRIALTRGRVPPARAVVVRSGPDRIDPRPPTRASTGTLDLVFAGMMNVQDRIDVLLHAVAEIDGRRPGSVRLVLVGTGDDVPRLRNLADRLGIAPVVTWTGWLEADDLREQLHTAAVGVSLDDDTPFSRLSTMTKIPEYLAVGLPCVVADLPENRVSAGDAARYFTPGSASALAEQLEELLDSPSEIDALREAALARAPGLLWEHSARRLVAAYAWLVAHGPAVAGEQEIAAAYAAAMTRA